MRFIRPLLLLIWPQNALADNKDADQASHLAIEAGMGALRADFTSDREAEINVSRLQPFVRFEYGTGHWVSTTTTIASEITDIEYRQKLNNQYRIRMNLGSDTNIFLAQGLKLHFVRYGQFSLNAVVQYELSLWDFETGANSVVVETSDDELDITREAREHVTAHYGWQRLSFALEARYRLGRFTPYVMAGWNILDANITFSYDEEARDTLALFGYQVPPEDTDHFRSGSLIATLGVEVEIWGGFAAHGAGIAVPDENGWVYAVQAGLIFGP